MPGASSLQGRVVVLAPQPGVAAARRHPDKNPDNPEAKEKFIQISKANDACVPRPRARLARVPAREARGGRGTAPLPLH